MSRTMTRRSFIGSVAAGAVGLAAASPLLAATTKGGKESRMDERGVLAHFSSLGLDSAMMSRIVSAALESGGEFCDVFCEHTVIHRVALEDMKVDRALTSVHLGVGIRVLVGDETGYAYSEDLDPGALLQAAKLASAIARSGSKRAAKPLSVRDVPSYYRAETPWSDVPIDSKISLLERIDRVARKVDQRIKRVSIYFQDETRMIMVANSEGLLRADYQPMTRTFTTCAAEDRGRREENMFNLAARAGLEFYTDERVERLGREAAERTIRLFEAVVPPAGELPVVLAAGSSGILLHEAIGHGMEADFNRKGTSIYSDRLGKPIAKDIVTIVDDGTNLGVRGSIAIDDEGETGRRTVLVERGVLRTYMHDRISSAHYKAPPTGSGRRESYKFPPIPRMRNTYMMPGPHTKEEIIRSVDKGIYAQTFTNGQVRIGAGDFTFYIKSGYMIEGGKLTRPIKDVNIIGNGPKVLERVSMVADDMALDDGGWTCGKAGQRVPVSLGLPTVKVDKITVGGVNG